MGKWIDKVKNSPQTCPLRTDNTDTPNPDQVGEVEQVPRNPKQEALNPDGRDVPVVLPQEQARPQMLNNIFCFTCFQKNGKAARYQPHRVAVWEEDPGWLELTCTSCGATCFLLDRWGGGEANG